MVLLHTGTPGTSKEIYCEVSYDKYFLSKSKSVSYATMFHIRGNLL